MSNFDGVAVSDLLEWLRSSETGSQLLNSIKENPDKARSEIEKWIHENARTSPPTVANVVAGGHVDKLIGSISANQLVLQLTSAPPLTPLHQLRAPGSTFSNRIGEQTEIRSLVSATAPRSAGLPIIGVEGMPGIGKTELAVAVGNSLAEDFPDGQLFVQVGRSTDAPMTVAQAMESVIRAFDPLFPSQANARDLAAYYNSVLYGKRVLIILDDVNDPDLLQDMQPPLGNCLIYTSSERLPCPGSRHVELQPLDIDSAVLLATMICPRLGSMAQSLCEVCGYSPLAIQIAASHLDANVLEDIPQYLGEIQDGKRRLSALDSTLERSILRLPEDLKRTLLGLSVFPVDAHPVIATYVADESHFTDVSLGRLPNSFIELRRRHLIQYDEETQRLSLHPLIRNFSRHQLTDEERSQIEKAMCIAFSSFAEGFSTMMLDGSRSSIALEMGFTDYLYALNWFDTEYRTLRVCIELSIQRHYYSETRSLIQSLMTYLFTRSMWQDVIDLTTASESVAAEIQDEELKYTSIGNRGVAYRAVGQLDLAYAMFSNLRDLTSKRGSRLMTSRAAANLAQIERMRGNYNNAIELANEALPLLLSAGDSSSLSMVYSELSISHAVLNELSPAITFARLDLEIAASTGNVQAIGQSLTNLSNLMYRYGDIEQAEHYVVQAIQMFQSIGDRHHEAVAHAALASVLAARDRLGDALQETDKAMQLLHGSHDDHLIGSIQLLRGQIWFERGAVELADFALAEARSRLRNDSPGWNALNEFSAALDRVRWPTRSSQNPETID